MIKEFENFDDSTNQKVEEKLAAEVMAVYLVHDKNGQTSNMGIIIEGSIVLDNLQNLSSASCLD
uniref:Uncharacterized protein n=1 Tax=Iconisemion striatum TaxID=60296 RepID=A0A1A7XUJ2_9TELE